MNYDQINSVQTVQLLMKKKFVLITSRYNSNLMANYYKQCNLHVSKEGFISHLGSTIAIRKDLNPKIASQINRM